MKKSLIFRILCKFAPELKVLKKQISWDEYANYKENCKISSKSKVNTPYNLQHVNIAKYSYIDRNSYISHTEIGSYSSIGPNFMSGWGVHPTNGLSTSPMFYSTKKQNGYSYTKEDKITERLPVTIGHDVFIGKNVTVLDGVNIGNGAIIGAGSVVSKDIPPYAVAVGSPIQIIKYRFDDEIIQQLLKINWWNFPDDKISEVERYFFDINSFIQKYNVS